MDPLRMLQDPSIYLPGLYTGLLHPMAMEFQLEVLGLYHKLEAVGHLEFHGGELGGYFMHLFSSFQLHKSGRVPLIHKTW